MKVQLIVILSGIASVCFAGDGDYAVSKIPDSLLKNADVVLRMEDIRFEINSTKDAVER
ncbi:MAG: hypothetical protein JST09_14315, partial [Bacteroidetes bacterium]|nr:hypothetical protein [Bacteroidota bacterium]